MKRLLLKLVLPLIAIPVPGNMSSQSIDLSHIYDMDYYYYRGEQVHLDINKSVLVVYYSEPETGKYLEDKYRLKPGGIVGADEIGPVQISDNKIVCVYTVVPSDYDAIYQSMRKEESVIDVIRVAGKEHPVTITASFSIYLSDDATEEQARSLASELGVEFIGYVGWGRWYDLKTDKNSVGDALVCSNLFYESGICKEVDPGFGIGGLSVVYGSMSYNGVAYKYDIEEAGIYYTVHEDGLYVSAKSVFVSSEKKVDSSYEGEIVIPEEVTVGDTVFKVVGVDHYAFYGCTSLNQIVIPAQVATIGDYAFGGCKELRVVNIQPGFISIGKYAFNSCSSLEEIVLPEGIESISEGSFHNCISLNKIVIPGSVRDIGRYAFYGCCNLKELYIPEGVKSLANEIIQGCINLKYLTIPESVENVDLASLIVAPHTTLAPSPEAVELPKLYLYEHKNHIRFINDEITVYKKGIDNLKFLSYEFLNMPEDSLFNCKIGPDVDSIPDFFQYNTNPEYSLLNKVESLYIPDNVKYIGKCAFYGFDNFKELVIDGSPVISESAFGRCDNLETIALSSPVPPSANITLSDSIFLKAEVETGDRPDYYYNLDIIEKVFDLPEASDGKAYYLLVKDSNGEITVDFEYDIPGWYDFYVSVVPNSLIPDAADGKPMYICAYIEYMDSTGNKHTYSRTDPKNSRKPFTFVVDGDKMDTLHVGRIYLENSTESGLKRTVSVRIKPYVTNSNSKTYSRALGLDCVMLKFVSLTDPALVTDPYSELEEQELSPEVKDSIVDALLETIFSRNVYENASLIVPENAISEYSASMLWKRFLNMEGYVSGGYDSDFDNDSFYFNLYNQVAFVAARDISREKFRGIFGFDGPLTPRDPIAGGLQPRTPLRILIRNRISAPVAGSDLYTPAQYSGNLIIPESVTFNDNSYSVSGIDYYAFLGCSELESVTVPEGVTNLGYGSFAGCIGLTSVVLPSGVRIIPDAIFYGCIRLDKIIIPEEVDTIGHSAFYECTGLTEIVIPSGVEVIDEYAFAYCVGLKRVVIEGNPYIAPTAFLGCGTELEIIKTGIESYKVMDMDDSVIHYSIDGREVAPDVPGLHIIRNQEGRVYKAVVR